MKTLSLLRLKKVLKNSKKIAPVKWNKALRVVPVQNYINYMYDLSKNGFMISTKSVVNDNLAKYFPKIKFIESDPAMDQAGDIDYLGFVGKKAFGIQVKPVTAQSSFGSYSVSERMKASFLEFENKFGGKVFIIFSVDDEIKNEEVVQDIKKEMQRLKKS